MFFVKDQKTMDMFDPYGFLGPKRRGLINKSWAKLFRNEILDDLPVHKLISDYKALTGRPKKELHAMLGLMILQQMHDLTDEEAIEQFAFNIKINSIIITKSGWSQQALPTSVDELFSL